MSLICFLGKYTVLAAAPSILVHPLKEIARLRERIEEADFRVSAQIRRIERMIEKGYDVTEATALLRHLETLLDNGTSGGSRWTRSFNAEFG